MTSEYGLRQLAIPSYFGIGNTTKIEDPILDTAIHSNLATANKDVCDA